RQRWQKPVLRRLQTAEDSVRIHFYFHPHQLLIPIHTMCLDQGKKLIHTRRVRRNLEQANNLLEAIIRIEEKKRDVVDIEVILQRTQMKYKIEEKKRDVVDIEVILQRTQMKYKSETELLEDSLALPGLPSCLSKFASCDSVRMNLSTQMISKSTIF
nr:hypothetical protein [Tanacetum cinerariifolium]